MQENNINPKVTELLEKIQKKNAKPTMSVMEMGKTLGLQKTDSYRLVNKRFFKTARHVWIWKALTDGMTVR